MPRSKKYTPFYQQFIERIREGFSLLDEKSQSTIKLFVRSHQHENGAFINRGGNPDLYYSLFGTWLSEALRLEPQKEGIQSFVNSLQHEENRMVDAFAMLLIRLVLNKKEVKKPGAFRLTKMAFQKGKQVNTAYRFFLFLLSFDAFYGNNSFILFLMNLFLRFYKIPADVPCSIFSAFIMAKYLTGRKVQKDVKQLFSYFETTKGFKAFKEVGNADLLSTAVALFALKTVGADVRIVVPDCLNLVQQNYDRGAFLSGDGDSSRDLEYTFYGLLTLGMLSKK